MKIISKTLGFYVISLIIGNLLLQTSMLFHETTVFSGLASHPDSIFLVFFIANILCFPLAVPTLIYFFVKKGFQLSFQKSIKADVIFAIIISTLWVLVLDYILDWMDEPLAWGCFVIGSAIGAAVNEIIAENQKQQSQQVENLNKSTNA